MNSNKSTQEASIAGRTSTRSTTTNNQTTTSVSPMPVAGRGGGRRGRPIQGNSGQGDEELEGIPAGPTISASHRGRSRSNSGSVSTVEYPTESEEGRLNQTSQPMDITLARVSPGAVATRTAVIHEVEAQEGALRDVDDREEEAEAGIGEATPLNQAKRSREDKGSSGNSEGHIRKAQDRSAIRSERVREERPEARLMPIGREEINTLPNPLGNNPSDSAGLQLPGEVSPPLPPRSTPSPPLLSSNLSQIAPDTEHRNAHLRLADSFSSLPPTPLTERPLGAQEAGNSRTAQEGNTPLRICNDSNSSSGDTTTLVESISVSPHPALSPRPGIAQVAESTRLEAPRNDAVGNLAGMAPLLSSTRPSDWLCSSSHAAAH